MYARQYVIVCDDSVRDVKRRLRRSVSSVSSQDNDKNAKPVLKCEVKKSPRAPEYQLHMGRANKMENKGFPVFVSVKKQPRKPVRQPGDSISDFDIISDDGSRAGSDISDKKGKDMVGLRVIACYNKDGLYYPGNVLSTKGSVYGLVAFNFGKKQKVRTQLIIPISGAVPNPELARGDFVLVRVYNQAREVECYVPGIIEFLPDSRQTPRFYSVLLYNGKTETTTRRCIVKVGRARFDMAVKYIAHIQQARQRSYSRQKSRSRSSSQSRSRSQSESRSTTPCNSPIERPSNPVPKPRPVSPPLRTNSMFENSSRQDIYVETIITGRSRQDMLNEKDQTVSDLQNQIEKQKRKQLRQQQRLVRQARKINKIQIRLNRDQHNDSLDKTKSTRSSGEESDTSPHRRKGSPDGTSVRETCSQFVPQRLQIGQEVLARWIDDGWYYRGCVDGIKEDDRYMLRDATGHLEEIDQDDIIVEEECKYYSVQPQDYVIGLHPKYVFSYAPAEVLGTYMNDKIEVEFYDGCTHTLSSDDVYKISKAKYENDRRYIMSREKHLVGKSVVARDNDTGVYRLAMIDSHCGLGQLYYVKWLDGGLCKQNANHIFEVGERQRLSHGQWEYVLAPVGIGGIFYLPAKVEQNGREVQFCNGSRSSAVRREQCFWLSEQYYKNAVEFYKYMNPDS